MPKLDKGGFTFDREKTQARIETLDKYFQENVMCDGRFVCQSFLACRQSHPHDFYEGQLHHIGEGYDCYISSLPFRIAIVGQEYGHAPRLVSMAARRNMILKETGLEKVFTQRNPHMRGTTSALRILFDLFNENDSRSEFIEGGGERLHIFDTFAMVNYLLCSAIRQGEGSRGHATQTMLKNCQRHFYFSLTTLQPNVIIVQSKGFSKFILETFDSKRQLTNELFEVRLHGHRSIVVTLSHPSTPSNSHNWGRSHTTPYLESTVKPALIEARRLVLDA